MVSQSYRLVVQTGPNPGMVFELKKGEITIGREAGNDIVLPDPEVSRKHARLIAQAGGYILEDTGSTNGTFVNGQRLMGPHLLRPGESILLGERVSLVFELAQFDPDATVVSGTAMPAGTLPPTARAAYSPPVQPIYAGQIAPAPAEPYYAPEAEGDWFTTNRRWILAGCLTLLILTCLMVVGFLFYIDAGGEERWCQYLGFLFPKYCP